MEILLILGGLIGLWVAARLGYRRRLSMWEQNRVAPRPDPMRPGIHEASALCLVIGILSCGFGLIQLLSQDYKPSTGRWSWLWNSVYATFGVPGVAAAWFALGATLVAIGIRTLRRHDRAA